MRLRVRLMCILLVAAASALPGCSVGIRPTSDATDDVDAAVFLGAVRWVAREQDLPVRVDPRPVSAGWRIDHETLLATRVSPEAIGQRSRVLAEAGIAEEDGPRAWGCLGTGGLSFPTQPIPAHCAALGSHYAVLVSQPWRGLRGGTRTVRVVVLSNSSVEVVDLTVRRQRDDEWSIVRSTNVDHLYS